MVLRRVKLVIVLMLVAIIISGSAYYFYFYAASPPIPHVGPNRAAFVDALGKDHPNPDFVKTVSDYVHRAGLEMDYYGWEKVDVEFIKSFPAGYKLVIFRVHSATSRHGVFYFTAEPYDENKYLPEQFSGELRPGKDFEGHPEVFAFGPEFAQKYFHDRFSGAIIIGLGCFGSGVSFGAEDAVEMRETQLVADNSVNLAQAFVSQGGAVSLIGWDRLVGLSHIEDAGLTLIGALTSGKTIREAVGITQSQVGPDPTYGGGFLYYPYGNGEYRLEAPTVVQAPSELSNVVADLRLALIVPYRHFAGLRQFSVSKQFAFIGLPS